MGLWLVEVIIFILEGFCIVFVGYKVFNGGGVKGILNGKFFVVGWKILLVVIFKFWI